MRKKKQPNRRVREQSEAWPSSEGYAGGEGFANTRKNTGVGNGPRRGENGESKIGRFSQGARKKDEGFEGIN